MYAVVVKVELPEGRSQEEGLRQLNADVIPMIKGAPGFVSVHFLAPESGQEGLSFTLFSDEASARAAAKMVNPPEPVKLKSVEVREVVASA
jgi:heme-degrading monooxygenase HmoA